nr:hypothetical protein [Francisella orientalis]
MKKLLVLLAGSVEWYEFTVYSFCAAYIGVAFFPGDHFIKFLAAFGAFAAGFLARPLGGINIWLYRGQKKSLYCFGISGIFYGGTYCWDGIITIVCNYRYFGAFIISRF